QIFYVTFYALFTPLGREVFGVSAPAEGRLAFGLGLLTSIIAGVLVKSIPTRSILIYGLAGLIFILAIVLPLSYFVLGAAVLPHAFAGAMFAYGVIISIFAIVGPEYDAPVLLQNQYKKYGVDEKTGADSTLFQAESFFWLNAARAIWAPVLGGVILLMKEHPGSLRILDQHG